MSSDKPLINRYLWAVGSTAPSIPVGQVVANRYQVVAPQIWHDLHPEVPPQVPEHFNSTILPYLRLYPHRLHIPEIYGVCQLEELGRDGSVILLENAPIDHSGQLYPTIDQMWSKASPVRQVYWLWQMLELWTPLAELGVSSTLLNPDNLRVEGWRVRLQELYIDGIANPELTELPGEGGVSLSSAVETSSGVSTALAQSPAKASLQQLGKWWEPLCRRASASVASALQDIAQQLQTENPSLKAIAAQLNLLLVEEASRQPLRLQVASVTDVGLYQNHNEDSYYPLMTDLPKDSDPCHDPLIPHLSIICDGIGGHEGGEVASHMAVQSIKIQVRALLAELLEDPEIMTPDLVAQQLAAIVRVVNNLIASCNDQQERASRRRMGTTLTVALQLPQVFKHSNGEGNTHELYIASVGDSRAYWITPHYCQQLTVDDDVATREVKMGRSLYRQALQRPDAGALTQAVGTKDAELLHPNVQRFILDEDGLLLLCSDGVSDNNWIEQVYANFARDVFSGKLSVEAAAKWLVEQANQRNGHDNSSVVLTYCGVSPQYPVVLHFGSIPLESDGYTINLETEFAQAAQGLESEELETPEPTETVEATSRADWFKFIVGILGVFVVLLSAGGAVLMAQWLLNPKGFEQMRDRFLPSQQQEIPPSAPESTPEE
ncbi:MULTISPECIES: PP2C family protein-serine/threonine phosphatase [unclassified Coleofasciculus]|uniref:PP2C family protein-serine/threonine phosphatase n=1 Tax=unclassified Coleofasciculus TaxID=2692782 RepID=UPI001880045B|nr:MULTISPECIES: protein phosphatase 2C domain-containing protein [unclassified Coleofasciculus]MBE9125302.1 protein phosphatase 2C domain-containing protein [Coleofasciculus sp. LEGE 07081]MBE9147083.1 protein phosphatase 2C domain-containing protein [Coleofasciculus sp. LEGE 07092]